MSEQHTDHTPEDVADRIAQLPGGLLDFDEPEAAPSEDEAAPEAEKVSPSEQEPEKEPDKAEGDEEKEDADKKPEAEEKDKPDAASEEDDPVYEVTLPDGSTEEVPLSELARGYQAAKEVETIKAESANVRREYERRIQEVPTLVGQKVQEEQNRLMQAIEQWVVANPEIPAPALDMLDENSPNYNPDGYYRQKEQRELQRAKAGEAAAQLQEIARQREARQTAYIAEERERLRAAWPELANDPAKQGELVQKAGEYFGLTSDDIASIQNHKAFLVLRAAIGFHEMKAKAPEIREKAKAPKPKPVKPGPRGSAKSAERSEIVDQRKRLKKTGRPEDAMAVFERMEF